MKQHVPQLFCVFQFMCIFF